MKMALYIMLLFAEAIIGFLAISLAWTNLGWIPCMVTIAVWAALLMPQIPKLIKAPDTKSKKIIRRRIALVMMVPILGFLMMFIYWFIDLSMAI